MLLFPSNFRHFLIYCGFAVLSIVTSKSALSNANPALDPHTLLDSTIIMLQNQREQAVSDYVDAYFHKDALERWNGEGRERYIGWLSAVKHYHKTFSMHEALPFDEKRNRVTARILSQSTRIIYTLTITLAQVHLATNDESNLSWKVSGISITADKPVIDSPLHALTKQELATKLAEYVDFITKNNAFSGSVLLADNDAILYQSAHGYAEQRFQIKNNVDTRFNIGSLNKMFTAVSVLQLAEAGKLSLRDPITNYIDHTLLGDGDFSAITIAHLLSHTAGLGYPSYPKTHPNDLRNLNDYLPYLRYIPIVSKPGEQFRYSSEGFILLGLIIEAVSKQPYNDYLQQQVFTKAGMAQTGNFDIDGVAPNMAMGYFYSNELKSMQTNWFIHGIKGNSAGGGYSNIADLYAFSKALTHNHLLSQKYTNLAFTTKPEFHSDHYGFGFSVHHGDSGKVIGHNGAFIGVGADLRVYLDKGITVVVLGNQDMVTTPVITYVNELMQHLQ
ncbi:serine hydrolase domain-containing protein [Pseudoalteromonas xiamenensis]|uniref:serine hydrolase domain-containing protein n=1 Tax=Pseudoalteromonas xiamenensis TaxID=882626 RepID=UPI0035ECAC17